MVGPPDSKNPPTTPAEALPDLTLNDPASVADVGASPDLPLEPEVDSLSAFVPEHAPIEQQDSVPPGELTQSQPARVDTVRPDTYIVWPVDDDDRSWWSRLRSLKASWKTKHLRRSAHDETVETVVTDADMPPPAPTGEVTMDAITNLEKHLASLGALGDACASIDGRLARVEEVSRQRDPAAIDEALHDVCSQISDRLVRVEAAVQRTEGFVADKPRADSRIPEMFANIEKQLVHARTELQRIEEAVAGKTLHELSRNIDARLGRTEDTLHRREAIVADSLQELSARVTARLAETEETIQRIVRERADETLRLTQQSFADLMLPELHELCKNIEARLGRTEDTLHRRENVVTEWLQELSADMTARFAEAEEAIQRIERIVSSRVVEQAPSHQPSVRTDSYAVQAAETVRATSERSEPADGGVLARAALFLSRFVSIERMNRPIGQPWVVRLAVPVLVLVSVLSIGALMRTSPGLPPENAVPRTTGDLVVTPAEPATNPGIRAASTTAPIPDVPPSPRESQVSVPRQGTPDRKSAATTSRPPRFVGTLSITSVPSGASVSINGKPAGLTPLRLRGQRAGSLAVQVAHDGFERWSAAVLVPADQLTQVTARLRAAR